MTRRSKVTFTKEHAARTVASRLRKEGLVDEAGIQSRESSIKYGAGRKRIFYRV